MSKYKAFLASSLMVLLFTCSAAAQKVSDTEITGGLKEALSKGVSTAIKSLGKVDGFLGNPRVKPRAAG